MHPSDSIQLSHACIDKRKTGQSATPRTIQSIVMPRSRARRCMKCARRYLRKVCQDLLKEIPPDQLVDPRVHSALPSRSLQSPCCERRVDGGSRRKGAKAKVWRKAGRAVDSGSIAIRGIITHAVIEESAEASPSGRFPSFPWNRWRIVSEVAECRQGAWSPCPHGRVWRWAG